MVTISAKTDAKVSVSETERLKKSIEKKLKTAKATRHEKLNSPI